MNASGKTTNCDPYEAASATSLSALSARDYARISNRNSRRAEERKKNLLPFDGYKIKVRIGIIIY